MLLLLLPNYFLGLWCIETGDIVSSSSSRELFGSHRTETEAARWTRHGVEAMRHAKPIDAR